MVWCIFGARISATTMIRWGGLVCGSQDCPNCTGIMAILQPHPPCFLFPVLRCPLCQVNKATTVNLRYIGVPYNMPCTKWVKIETLRIKNQTRYTISHHPMQTMGHLGEVLLRTSCHDIYPEITAHELLLELQRNILGVAQYQGSTWENAAMVPGSKLLSGVDSTVGVALCVEKALTKMYHILKAGNAEFWQFIFCEANS